MIYMMLVIGVQGIVGKLEARESPSRAGETHTDLQDGSKQGCTVHFLSVELEMIWWISELNERVI